MTRQGASPEVRVLFPRRGPARPTPHSLHLGGARPPHGHHAPIKADRLVVGLAAGAALLYVVGRALGLGRR
ncbi:MAG: hypothetical protein U5S82_14245 [Gammaproteobacteria bacterium]|nr:hypothetical protein [Gammaproteobacteria bacterium]